MPCFDPFLHPSCVSANRKPSFINNVQLNSQSWLLLRSTLDRLSHVHHIVVKILVYGLVSNQLEYSYRALPYYY